MHKEQYLYQMLYSYQTNNFYIVIILDHYNKYLFPISIYNFPLWSVGGQ